MNDHDPLCRQKHWTGGDCYDCRLIARVRADEQAKLEAEISERIYGARGIHARNYIAERDLKRALAELAEVRERLRAQVKALPHGHDKDGTVCMIGYGAGCTCWKRDVLALLGGGDTPTRDQ